MRTRLPSPQGDTEAQRASPLTEERAISVSQNLGRPSICSPRSFLSSRSEGKDLLDPATLLLVQSAPTLNPTCWDELVKATKPEKYWWFIFILLLKLLVNVLFLIGQALEYNWGMWLQITLVLAALLSHFQKPYVLQDDNQQEQLSFLGLVLVLSVTNSGVVYAGSWLWYHVVVVGAVVGALTFSVVWVHYTVFKTRAAREQRVARGEKGLKQFTRQAFATVVPTFLLLTQHERDAIRAHIQVETFESGEVIYEEGDPAQAFFIIKEGTVKLQTTHKDTDARLVGERDAFGAGALAMDSQHCSATAIAVSANVVCLRLIRDDWMRLWPLVTETVARELFSKLDFDHSGQIELVSLSLSLSLSFSLSLSLSLSLSYSRTLVLSYSRTLVLSYSRTLVLSYSLHVFIGGTGRRADGALAQRPRDVQ
jgi:CRP-like cAMP-binding protein